jgi:hypothetical protein
VSNGVSKIQTAIDYKRTSIVCELSQIASLSYYVAVVSIHNVKFNCEHIGCSLKPEAVALIPPRIHSRSIWHILEVNSYRKGV